MMKGYKVKVFLSTFMLICLVSNVKSQPREQIFVGARPLGLGETYVAIADDGNAVYWNPAGLPNLKRIEFNSMYANLYNISGLQNLYLSLVYPITPRYVFGLGWFHVGFDDDELEFFRNKANLSFGAKVYDNLLLGANLKYLSTDARLDGRSEGSADGLGFDLGAFYFLPISKTGFLKQINFGMVAYDIGGTNVKFDDTSVSEEILHQNIRFGFTLIPKEELSLKWFSLKDALFAFDFDDRFHLGTEFWLIDNLGLRAGFQKDFQSDEGITYSFGGSFKFPKLSMQLDYAYTIPPTLSATHLFSFSFASSPSPVKITDISLNTLYSSFYKSYATSHIGYVTVRNDYDKELQMTLKVSIPGLTESSTQENFKLGPGERKRTFFPAVFSKKIMDISGADTRQANIRIEYKIKNEQKFVDANKKFKLFGRGAITWEDPSKAAAFITKLDRMVELFAREVTKDLPYKPEIELGNIYKAATLFDALGVVGIKYNEDPVNPFSTIPKTQHSVDRIQYPAELLTSKQGDCDDLTVLYASLLENSGIKTALVSTEDHITLMFDTGIHERNWGLLPLGDSLVVVKNKTLWIPVEVTEVGASFAEAWYKGGKNYQEWKDRDDFEVVMIRDVEGLYLSALLDEFQKGIPDLDLPEPEKLKKMVENDALWLHQQRMIYGIENFLAELAKRPGDDRLRNKLGIILAQLDSIDKAEIEFRNILEHQPENTHARINLGNIDCIFGRFKDAEESYLEATKQVPNEPGLFLNLAILYQLWSIGHPDSSEYQKQSEKYLLLAFQLLDGDELLALDLLGISGEDIYIAEKADLKSWVKKQASAVKKFIKDSAKKYLFDKSVKGTRIKRTAVKRGPDEERRYILWWAYQD
ncbi:MAG: PorV/PorQ family protein [bacterium]